MGLETVRQELLDGGLHEQSVKRLLEHYQSMQTRMKEGEYDEAGTHIGNFSENMVNILRDQMDESVQSRPDVGTFVDSCTSRNIGNSEPDSIQLQVPRTLRAAYDIRNNRDSVHVNLKVPVNHADTQAGIAMCSWMLAEVLRTYGASDDTDDMKEVGDLIEELSEPVTDGNPLKELETSHDDFDRQSVVRALNSAVQIAEGEVRTKREFNSLDTTDKVVTLLLGRRAAADLNHLDNAGVSSSWLGDCAGVSDSHVRHIIGEFDFIEHRPNIGGYYIPGYRVEGTIDYLELD